MAAPYAKQSDLLLGDLAISPSIPMDDILRAASDEIDARLGELYVVPLAGLTSHHATLVKLICARLASGRLILAAAIGGEDRTLHAYGESLIRDAYNDLNMIATGKIILTGVQEVAGQGNSDNMPGIVNYDSDSVVTSFERTIMRGEDWYWEPGQ